MVTNDSSTGRPEILPDDDILTRPDGWALPAVSDVCRLVNGYGFKSSQWSETGRPIIRIQNLNNTRAGFNRYDGELSPKYKIRSGDLLFAWSGTPGTSFGAHIWHGADAWLNQHIYRVDLPRRMIDRVFFMHALNARVGEFISAAQGGVGLAHITKRKLESSFVALAPLAEQKRVAHSVDALLRKAEAIQDRLRSARPMLERLRLSILHKACSGNLTADWRMDHIHKLGATDSPRSVGGTGGRPTDSSTLPETWTRNRAEQLCEENRDICYGVIKLGEQVDGGVPILRSSNVRRLYLDTAQMKSISPAIECRYPRSRIRGGEVLVTVRGTLGGVVVAPLSAAGSNVSREVAVIPVSKAYNPHYVATAIAWGCSQSWLRDVQRGVTYVGINIRDLKNLPLPIPHLLEQGRIVERVQRLLTIVDTIDERILQALGRLTKMHQAILAKAFRGELVPTEAEIAQQEGRDYETASELLERIKADRERASENTSVKKRSAKQAKKRGSNAKKTKEARKSKG